MRPHLGGAARSLSAVAVSGVLLGGVAEAEIEGETWFPIGPAPIEGFFAGGVTGRASAVAVNPTNSADIWLGTATGGVWHSTNGGQSFVPMSDREKSLAIGALALGGCKPSGCVSIYAGTGENAIRRDTYHGVGLLVGEVSPDGFAWFPRDGTPKYNFRGGSINDIVLVPGTTGVRTALYITLSSGVTVSASEATVTAPEPSPGGYGIYKSPDQGLSWTKLTVPGAEGSKPTDLEMDPRDSRVLYAGFWGRGIFKTVDGGAKWCPLSDDIPKPNGCPETHGLPNGNLKPFDHVEIAIFPGQPPAPGTPAAIYATLGHCADRLIPSCQPSVYKSSDGGDNWTLKWPGQPQDPAHQLQDICPSGYSAYTHALAVDPTNENVLYVGGVRLCRWREGQTPPFQLSDGVPPPYGPCEYRRLHSDHREISIDPRNAQRMYDTSDGGFAISEDGGQDWLPVNRDLQITGFQSIASSALTPRVIGGSQDIGGQMWSGARTWDYLACCGDGGFTVMDRDDPLVMYAGSNFGEPQRSCDGGRVWSSITGTRPAQIDPDDPEAFYAPFVQDPSPPHPLYIATNRLYRSCDRGDSWCPVSPVLSSSPEPEIFGGRDVITAIAVAPSNPKRIYVGYYSGRVFVADTDGPCASPPDRRPGCPPPATAPRACPSPAGWRLVSAGLPGVPVTRITVHPKLADRAFVTLSGFGGHPRVWKTEDGGGSWTPSANGLPPGIPANTMSIEPSAPDQLWLGLDSGPDGASLYKSVDGGESWATFAKGLPNAPVYEISIDEAHGRVYAATHGRGAFVLGRPFLSNFEAWIRSEIRDIPLYGHGFPAKESCTLEIVQTNGTVCASGSVDAMGGTIRTDQDGALVTSRADMWEGKPAVWACFRGRCVGDTPIGQCNPLANPLSAVRVTCGGEFAFEHIVGFPQIANPPSSLLTLDRPNVSTWCRGSPLSASSLDASAEATAPGASASFDLTASVQAGDRSVSLCTVPVPVRSDDDQSAVLERAASAVNASSTCQAAGVTAALDRGPEPRSEDESPRPSRLRLSASARSGMEVVTAVHVAPGQVMDTSFDVSGLGVPVLDQVQVLALALETHAGGAAGGELTVVEHSWLGSCAVTVPTSRGQTAAELAAALESALQAPGIPGPHPDCPADRNPRDATADGGRLILVSSTEVEVRTSDPGVGFALRPEDLKNTRPHADAGVSRDVPCAGPGGAAVTLDGSGSSDPDSTPGTNDDIRSFEWFEDLGAPSAILLGTGRKLIVTLPLGSHSISLRVTDATGLTDVDTIRIRVVDDRPPRLSVELTPNLLWPPNHRMVDVAARVVATDECGDADVVLASIVSSEPDDAPGSGDGHTVNDIQGAEIGTPDFAFRLRAERAGGGPGRTYTVRYRARDGSGNASTAAATVVVPHDRGGHP